MGNASRASAGILMEDLIITKVCRKCGIERSIDLFRKHYSYTTLRPDCRKCENVYNLEKNRLYRQRKREAKLRKE